MTTQRRDAALDTARHLALARWENEGGSGLAGPALGSISGDGADGPPHRNPDHTGNNTMQIQVSTDENIEGREAMAAGVEAVVTATLSHFSQHLTRVEVHISDENADKPGQRDKRCMMEARPTHQQPLAVTHEAPTVDEACAGAVKKLRSLLETHFGRLHDVKGAASIRDNENR